MALTLTQLQVLPVVSDTSTFYLSMQPVTAGTTTAEYVAPAIWFNPSQQMLTVDQKINMTVTGSLKAPILNSSVDSTVIGANTPSSAIFTTAAATTSIYSNKIGLYANTSTTTSAVYQVYNSAINTLDTIFG